jgi:hypothetical protein
MRRNSFLTTNFFIEKDFLQEEKNFINNDENQINNNNFIEEITREDREIFKNILPFKKDEIIKEEENKKLYKNIKEEEKFNKNVAKTFEDFPLEYKEKISELMLPEKGDENKEVLKVINVLPKGQLYKQNMLDFIMITFNQPIITLNELEEFENNNNNEESQKNLGSIIKIIPNIKGEFQYIGTKIIKFLPKEKFLLSTKYSVTIKQKTITSILKNSLQEDIFWEFITPLPTLEIFFPNNNINNNNNSNNNKKESFKQPLFFCKFDQELDKTNFFQKLQLQEDTYSLSNMLFWKKEYNFKLLSLEDFTILLNNKNYSNLKEEYDNLILNNYNEKNCILFTVKEELNSDYKYKIIIPPGKINK